MKNPKEYRLLKDSPGIKAGAIFTWDKEEKSYVYEWEPEDDCTDNRWLIGKEEMLDLVKEGWFEPIPERIELTFISYGRGSGTPIGQLSLNVKGRKPTLDDIELWEQASNGERFTKEDMIKMMLIVRNNPHVIGSQCAVRGKFRNWIASKFV